MVRDLDREKRRHSQDSAESCAQDRESMRPQVRISEKYELTRIIHEAP